MGEYGSQHMSRIGVYVVDPSELDKPPVERLYERRGMYDVANAKWTDSTDRRLPIALPSDQRVAYSISEIQDAVETATVHVYREDEVPGQVLSSGSTIPGHSIASD